MKKKRIYIAAPYRANEHGTQQENIERAWAMGLRVNIKGHAAIVPHLLLAHIDEVTDRARALNEGLELLEECDELWICSNHVTSGMQGEMNYALDNGIPVYNRFAELFGTTTKRRSLCYQTN